MKSHRFFIIPSTSLLIWMQHPEGDISWEIFTPPCWCIVTPFPLNWASCIDPWDTVQDSDLLLSSPWTIRQGWPAMGWSHTTQWCVCETLLCWRFALMGNHCHIFPQGGFRRNNTSGNQWWVHSGHATFVLLNYMCYTFIVLSPHKKLNDLSHVCLWITVYYIHITH